MPAARTCRSASARTWSSLPGRPRPTARPCRARCRRLRRPSARVVRRLHAGRGGGRPRRVQRAGARSGAAGSRRPAPRRLRRARWRAARPRSGARACAAGSPGWPAAPARRASFGGRRPAVVGLELRRQLGAAHVDRGPPRGPRPGQVAVDADDLAHRPLAPDRRPGRSAKRDAEPVDELGLEAGVVPLGGGDVGLEHSRPSRASHRPSQGLHLVADRRRGCAGPGRRRGSRGG